MSESIVYLNGEYTAFDAAQLSITDRATLFGEGVYEVVRFANGIGYTMKEHHDRLLRSLEGIMLDAPAAAHELPQISEEIVKRNGFGDAGVYWQITRGSGPRSFVFPDINDQPANVFAYAWELPPLQAADADMPPEPVSAHLVPDERWLNCWIKSTMLMPNNIALNKALRAGFGMPLMHRDGIITESNSANVAFIKDGTVITHPADGKILGGITRQVLLQLLPELGIPLEERYATVEEFYTADEAFTLGTTTFFKAITQVDDHTIGTGAPGPLTTQIKKAFLTHHLKACNLL